MDHLSALPAELSVHVAGFLTLADAHALSLTHRDTMVAASEVLHGERVAYGRLVACPDAADLLRRVGIGRLRRAWRLSDGRPYAALCSQLEGRLGRALEASGGEVPFAIATCDAPGSVMMVMGANEFDGRGLLRTVAAISQTATGRLPVVPHSFAPEDRRRWMPLGSSKDVLWRDLNGVDGRLLAVDDAHGILLCHTTIMTWWVAPPPARDGAIVFNVYGHSTAGRELHHSARICALNRCVRNLHHVKKACTHLDPPPGEDELRELRAQLASLALCEWLVIDGWQRRWQRWTPARL